MADTPEPKAARTPSEQIQIHLRRARKLAGDRYDENPARVAFMLEEARILATLQVADALRGAPPTED